jgi:hypothetical protein
MPGFKNPLDVLVKRAEDDDARIRKARPLINNPSKRQSLEEQLKDPAAAARFHDFVADLFPGGETQATPAPRRHPEHDASSGGKGAGAGQHLYAVPAEVVQLRPFIVARDRRQGRLPSFPRPTGGSAA